MTSFIISILLVAVIFGIALYDIYRQSKKNKK